MPYDIPHTVSPSLWALAWKRLRNDRVAMASLAIVVAFLVMMVLSATGLIAKDWAQETGKNYAPPSFLGNDIERAEQGAKQEAAPVETPKASEAPTPVDVKDPLADVLAEIRGKGAAAGTEQADSDGIVDPIGDVIEEIRAKGGKAAAVQTRAATLPFGGDKWGRDVLKKTIKGSETSIFVGLAAAIVATLLGTIFGAVAGYYGKWVDDFFNWFYSVFTAMPPLLLILAIAAVLHERGIFTIILIMGLTGWTGTFRLIRSEYLKHKGREYVQAADAIGASNARRMFVHIFPNVSHVALVQMSIYTVGFIKYEVILSFLGLGVPVDAVSWGSMLNEAQNELILGKWWQLAAAATAMALLVTAFSLFTDSLRDALDPKLK